MGRLRVLGEIVDRRAEVRPGPPPAEVRPARSGGVKDNLDCPYKQHWEAGAKSKPQGLTTFTQIMLL